MGLAGAPISVPWDFLAPHERQAVANHDQTLQRLAERGGLGSTEMLCVLDGLPWRLRHRTADGTRYLTEEEGLAEIRRRVAAWEDERSLRAEFGRPAASQEDLT